ncbi:hypothetical protein [Anaerocolumna sp.]|uniref:hypothetical protein n=1 Tax=Anaerocolumna sp. TaxID=2041569 RepID=UPI0028AA91B5|nr:hypothetical protein [Anaerocolumna sp.]
MAKGVYFGVGEKARKVKKLYFGVGDKSRKVKKMFFGVDGKARICYSAGLSKVKTMTVNNKVEGRWSNFQGACTSIGSYLLIDSIDDKSKGHAEYINTSLIRGDATPAYGAGRKYKGAASNSNYAIFTGGLVESNNYYSRSGTCYTPELTITDSITFIKTGRSGMGCGTIANNAVFAGGDISSSAQTNIVDVVNSSLGVSVLNLPFDIAYPIGLNIGGVLLFAHGYNRVAAYNYSTAYITQGLSVSQHTSVSRFTSSGDSAGAANKNYALYQNGSSVDVFTANLAYDRLENFPGSYRMAGLSFDDYAVFAGGTLSGNKVYVYDKNLVVDVLEDLSESKTRILAGKLGDRGFFIGGALEQGTSNLVDIYEI